MPILFIPAATSDNTLNGPWNHSTTSTCHFSSFISSFSIRRIQTRVSETRRARLYMLFDDLTTRIQETFSRLSSGQLFGEKQVEKALNEVKMALIDADVNITVVDQLLSNVDHKIKATKLPKGVTSSQMFIKLMHDELTELLGGKETYERKIVMTKKSKKTMFIGLQGSGKTTTVAKFAHLTKKRLPEAKILLVACDTRRPASVEQLQILGKSIGCETFTLPQVMDATKVLEEALKYSAQMKADFVFIDTAGRQVVDGELMNELKELEEKAAPEEVILVLDAMTGQEAANVTKLFADAVNISGTVLTKLDSDTRGGAALSIRAISGLPVWYMGTSEKLDGLEAFYAERIASRILGMGDVVSLVEKAQEAMSENEAKAMANRMLESKFNFDDFLKQLSFVSSMGSLGNMLKLIPGMGSKLKSEELQRMERNLKVAKVIIQSMTREERKNPELLLKDKTAKSRIERIRKGSGRSVEEVNSFIRMFENAQKTMKQVGSKMLNTKDADSASPFQPPNIEGNRAQRRKLNKVKESKSKDKIKRGFGK
eukprot:jgi/Galph1/2316/GphlegSOOS_G1005.1